MQQVVKVFEIRTSGKALVEVTRGVSQWVEGQGLATGLLTLFCRHTSASLLIQENAAYEVKTDLESFFERLAPEDSRRYSHADEGPDDMPAHLRAALTNTSLSVPLIRGKLALGTWQGIYLFEHRSAPHRREIAAHLFGE